VTTVELVLPIRLHGEHQTGNESRVNKNFEIIRAPHIKACTKGGGVMRRIRNRSGVSKEGVSEASNAELANTAIQLAILRREMLAAGDRLRSALSREHDACDRLRKKPKDSELLDEWLECRRSVEGLGQDYVTAAKAYRTRLVATITSES